MNASRPIGVYLGFVRASVFDVQPGQRVRHWRDEWLRTFSAMAAANALFDVASLVVARWEFLGGLFAGTTDFKAESGRVLARRYTEQYLLQVNPRYGAVAELVDGQQQPDRFDIFTVLRNKPLHGVVPGSTATKDLSRVVTWWMGFTGVAPDHHLRVDAPGGFGVCVTTLYRELGQSMALFAEYLDENLDPRDGRMPQARWRRSYWARFCPSGYPHDKWLQQGIVLGVDR